MSFPQALQFTLQAEGGFTIDDGGPTNYGITQVTYDTFRKAHNLQSQTVRSIAMYEVHDIYLTMYWNPSGAMYCPLKVGIAHFDWAVNHGVEGAIKSLQTVLQITSDGIVGPETQSALISASDDDLLILYLDYRRQWYRDNAVSNPDDAQYLDGWLNRVNLLQAYLGTLTNG